MKRSLAADEKEEGTQKHTKRSCARSTSDVVTINVGGKRFQTCVSTLTSHEKDWMLAKAFSGTWSPTDAHFYDADSRVFESILLALRTQTKFVPPENVPSAAVEQQLTFWGLDWFAYRHTLHLETDEDRAVKFLLQRLDAWIRCSGQAFRALSGEYD